MKLRKRNLPGGNSTFFFSPQEQECENDTYLGVWNTIPPKRLDYYQARKRNSAVTLSFEELEDCLAAEEGPAAGGITAVSYAETSEDILTERGLR